MSAEARRDIYALLRHAAGERSGNDILRDSWALGQAPQPTLPAADVHEAFIANVLRNCGSVACAADRGGAVKAIADFLLERHRSQRLVAGNDPRLAALPWRDAGLLPRFGSAEPGEPVALSYAQLGIAELGAVVTCTGRGNPSRNNLLPEDHVVLVDASRVVASCEHAWDILAQEVQSTGLPRGINFIAGPSSTADIEGQLVYGAHGPRGWHVILVGEIAADALERAQAAVA